MDPAPMSLAARLRLTLYRTTWRCVNENQVAQYDYTPDDSDVNQPRRYFIPPPPQMPWCGFCGERHPALVLCGAVKS